MTFSFGVVDLFSPPIPVVRMYPRAIRMKVIPVVTGKDLGRESQQQVLPIMK